MIEKEFAHFIQMLETRDPGPDCLESEQLAALASGVTDGPESASLRQHLTTCLDCLQAYASLQALLAIPIESTAREHGAGRQAPRRSLVELWRDGISSIRQVMAVPIPLAWPAGVIAAVAIFYVFDIIGPSAPGLRHSLLTERAAAIDPYRTTNSSARIAEIRAAAPAGLESARPPVANDARPANSGLCGGKSWRIDSIVTKDVVSHIFVCGDGENSKSYEIVGRPSRVIQTPGMAWASLAEARITPGALNGVD